jgi:hypothetical protein
MSTKYVVMVRRKIVENTDPQRRCYNGCNFSERVYWSDWDDLLTYDTEKEARITAIQFQQINPKREYRVIGITV